ncbi:MAG: phage regulatory CII family protein [Lentisphaerota bacterium]
MNTQKVLKRALFGCDRKEVAKYVGMSPGSLNNQVAGELPYMPKGQTMNFVDRVVAFIDITHATTGRMILLEQIAEEFSYMLVKNPAINAASSPAIAKVSEILRDFASVVDEISKATGDQVIESDEAEKIRAKWEIMKRVTEEFVLACETGAYGPAKNGKE